MNQRESICMPATIFHWWLFVYIIWKSNNFYFTVLFPLHHLSGGNIVYGRRVYSIYNGASFNLGCVNALGGELPSAICLNAFSGFPQACLFQINIW